MDLREYLFRHDMSAAEFARKIDYTSGYVNDIINGFHIPSERCAKAISSATGGIVPIDGISTKKRGRALRKAKKACQGEQLCFAEMEK